MGLYEIAGLTVAMDVTGRTFAQAAPYACLCQPQPDVRICCDPEQFIKVNPHLTDRDAAMYLATGATFARALLNHQGFQFHASAVALDGQGYLFTAPCGTGKSTHAEKWCRLFGAQCINDDKPALRRLEEGWMVWGTPWSGKHDLSSPIGVPLAGIACLRQSSENRIRRMSAQEALPYILSQCIRQLTLQQSDVQLQLVDRLLQEVPVWLLECNIDDEAATVSLQAMTEVQR